jgi:hypothetical protein
MADKKQIANMIDDLIKSNGESAQVNFHKFATDKVREKLYGTDGMDLDDLEVEINDDEE